MKIKLAILEKDTAYLSRMISAFGAKFADKVEMYSFTDKGIAMSTLVQAKIDVLLSGDTFEIDLGELPRRCAFAYLVDSIGVDTVNGQKAICKYQKAELIYKQILSVYAEKAGNVSGLKLDGDACNVIAFVSMCGGAGSSSAAAACARRYAAQGKKCLYLNLEAFGNADLFFSAEGQFDLSDVIFALKSKKANLPLKLESCVRRDGQGVYFYAGAKVALDVMELDSEEIIKLLSELKLTGAYDYILLDMEFSLDKACRDVLRRANAIVVVNDGSEMGNSKTSRALHALNILEQNHDDPLTKRMKFFYNKFSNKTSKILADTDISEIGGSPRYQHATISEIISALAALDAFDKIF